MAGKVKVQPISRVGLEPLVDIAEHLRAAHAGWDDLQPATGRQRVPSDLGFDLAHLATHDGDGFLMLSVEDEVVGFATAYVRSRLLTLSGLWLLPEHDEPRLAELLIRRCLAFGERSGANEVTAALLGGAPRQAQLFRFGLRPRFPVYRLVLGAEDARRAGVELLKLLPGVELSAAELRRRAGSGDLERLDRLTRGVTRPMDHEYWLSERGLRLATVRDGNRLAGYAYGGATQCGPVAAATPEAALAGLGWALHLAIESGAERVSVLVPAAFEAAVDHLLDAGATCPAVMQWMSRNPLGGMERYVLPGITLF